MGCTNSKETEDIASKPRRPSKLDNGDDSGVKQLDRDGDLLTTKNSQDIAKAKRGDFRDNYKLGDVLGQGSFSVVRLGKRISDGVRVAVKIVSRKRLKKEDELSLRAEVQLLISVNHPNIVSVFDFFEEPDYFYVVLEYVSGGELFDRIIEKEFYTEGEARDLFTILLRTVKYCHDRNIIHRDIKPENVLLASKNDDISIKLADFGFAVLAGEPVVKKQAGTPGYIAPEIVRGLPHGKPVDCWSLGVVLFMLVGGYPPFYEEGDELKEIFRKIVNAEYEFHPENWQDISSEAKDLVKGLLTLDPKKRLTVDQALQHPWLQKSRNELTVVSLNKNFAVMKASRAAMAQGAASIAIEAVRQLSGANLTKNMSLNEVAIDVIRKISGANLNDAVIEAARKKSGASLTSSNHSRTPSPSTHATLTKASSNPRGKTDEPKQQRSRPAGIVEVSSDQNTAEGEGIQVSRKKSGAGLTGFSINRSGVKY